MVARKAGGATADVHLASKQARRTPHDLSQLVALAHQAPVVRQPDDVAALRGLELREQVVVVAFTIHDVNGADCPLQPLLTGAHRASPTERFSLRSGAQVAPIQVTLRRFGARPSLGSEHPQRRTGGGHDKTRVKPEPTRRTCVVDPTQSLSVAAVRQHRGVVQHEHSAVCLAPQPRLLGVRRVDCLEGHLVVVQESVQALKLPLRPHRFRKAQTWIARQIHRDPLHPLAAATVAKDRTSVL
jgi:hypothetical protein